MSPRDRAAKVLSDMSFSTHRSYDPQALTDTVVYYDSPRNPFAKDCAIAAVDLVLHTARADENCTSREYWLLVKKEIQNL